MAREQSKAQKKTIERVMHARRRHIPGRSRMSKGELERGLGR